MKTLFTFMRPGNLIDRDLELVLAHMVSPDRVLTFILTVLLCMPFRLVSLVLRSDLLVFYFLRGDRVKNRQPNTY
jgi:hypothetical protein